MLSYQNLKKPNTSSNIDRDMITVNNFFARWIKEISITTCGSDKELIPKFFPYKIYQYADAVLKHLPEKALKTIEKTHLYSKKSVYYADSSIDRRIHNGDGISTMGLNATQIPTLKKHYAKDHNIDDRISKFKTII